MNGHDTDRRDQLTSPQSPRAPEAALTQPIDREAGGRSRPGTRAHARLRQRSEFLAVAKGVRVHDAAFTVQAIRREPAQEGSPVPRFGLTVTKKTGNSVVRNRIRRRLREALRHTPAALSPALPEGPGFDYVIVARREALTRDFGDLARDIARSVTRAQGRLAGRTPGKPAGRTSGHAKLRKNEPDDKLQDLPGTPFSQTDERPGPTS